MRSPASRDLIILLATLSLLYVSIGAQNQTENECSENQDCEKPYESYECEDGKCLCSKIDDVYTFDEDYKCLKLVNINGSCALDKQCSYLTNRSKCDDGICECIPGFVYSPDMGVCEPLITTSQTENVCSEDKDCEKPYESYVCENETCVCSKNDVYTLDAKYKCLQLVNMNDSCEIREQCSYRTSGSNCTDGSCQCNSGLIYSTNARVCSRPLQRFTSKPLNKPQPRKPSTSPFLIAIIVVVVVILGCIICCCCCCKKKKNLQQIHQSGK